MKRWRGTLVVSYTQEIEVNADTQAEAEDLMRDAFDPTRCYNTAECQAYDVEELISNAPPLDIEVRMAINKLILEKDICTVTGKNLNAS